MTVPRKPKTEEVLHQVVRKIGEARTCLRDDKAVAAYIKLNEALKIYSPLDPWNSENYDKGTNGD